MKKCSYCGRDNADEAVNCHECGTEFETTDAKAEAESVKPEDQKKTLTLRIFPNHEAAGIAAAKLKAHAIECWVNSDDCGGMYPSLTTAEGARLNVWEEDEAIANAVLDAKPTPEEDKKIEIEAVLATAPKAEPKRKFAWGQILLAFFAGVIVALLFQWKDATTTTTHYHYTADGKRDEGWIYRGGHLMEHLRDRNLDGAWDYWTYYEHGKVVRTEEDNNFDGKPDEFWTYSDNGIDTLQADTDFNGIPDVFATYKNGIIQNEEIRPNGSKFATQREYFKNGVLTEIWSGGDSNGNFSEVIRYDPFFNPISTNAPTKFQLTSPTAK